MAFVIHVVALLLPFLHPLSVFDVVLLPVLVKLRLLGVSDDLVGFTDDF